MDIRRSTSRTNGKSCTHLELCLESTPCKLQVTCLTGNVKMECKNRYIVTATAGLKKKLRIMLQSDSPVARLLMCNQCVSISSWLRNWSWVCSLLRQNLVLCLWNCEYTQWQLQHVSQKRCSSHTRFYSYTATACEPEEAQFIQQFRSYTATACEPEAVLKLMRIYLARWKIFSAHPAMQICTAECIKLLQVHIDHSSWCSVFTQRECCALAWLTNDPYVAIAIIKVKLRFFLFWQH